MLLRSSEVKALALSAGFDLCGITRAEFLSDGAERYLSWLSSGRGGGLDYLGRYLDVRFDASLLVPGGRSVVVCAVNYKSEHSLRGCGVDCGVGISSYALSRDYHKSLRKRLKGLLRELEVRFGISGRVFVDSAPLLEKALAVRAGLGCVGRQSLLVTPDYGSFVLLGELVLDCDVDVYDKAFGDDLCGCCRRCVDSCPVGAIGDDRSIDARLCLASRTIEVGDCGDGCAPLHGWIFGCDVCQSCCPRNHRTPLYSNSDLRPLLPALSASEWLSMSDDAFEAYSVGTPLRRSSLLTLQAAVVRNQSSED